MKVVVILLRDRARDIAPLAASFVERFAAEYGKLIRGLDQEPSRSSPRRTGRETYVIEHALERAVLSPHRVRERGPPPARRRRISARSCWRSRLRTIGRGQPLGLEWLTDLTRVALKQALEGPSTLIERALARHGGRRDRAAETSRSTVRPCSTRCASTACWTAVREKRPPLER